MTPASIKPCRTSNGMRTSFGSAVLTIASPTETISSSFNCPRSFRMRHNSNNPAMVATPTSSLSSAMTSSPLVLDHASVAKAGAESIRSGGGRA